MPSIHINVDTYTEYVLAYGNAEDAKEAIKAKVNEGPDQ